MHEHLPDNGGGSWEIHGSLQALPLPTTSGHVVCHQKVLIVAPQIFWTQDWLSPKISISINRFKATVLWFTSSLPSSSLLWWVNSPSSLSQSLKWSASSSLLWISDYDDTQVNIPRFLEIVPVSPSQFATDQFHNIHLFSCPDESLTAQ